MVTDMNGWQESEWISGIETYGIVYMTFKNLHFLVLQITLSEKYKDKK